MWRNKSIIKIFLIVCCFGFLFINANQTFATTTTYTTPGTYTWTCPAGVTQLTLDLIGGGASGGGGGCGGGPSGGNGDGGCYNGAPLLAPAGSRYQNTITVVPGTNYTVVVGDGGAGVAGGTTGNVGQASTFTGGYSAAGGTPGGRKGVCNHNYPQAYGGTNGPVAGTPANPAADGTDGQGLSGYYGTAGTGYGAGGGCGGGAYKDYTAANAGGNGGRGASGYAVLTYSVAVNGVCGTTNNACTAGTTSDTPADTTTAYQWTCLGTNGGTNAACTIPKAYCTSAGPDEVSIYGNTHDVFAYGVGNASSFKFATWTSAGGQDDLVWHVGTNLGGGTWKYTIDFTTSHNNELGYYYVHAYGWDAVGAVFCDTANFTRTAQPGQCGTADGRKFLSTETNYVSYPQCSLGTSTNTTFPTGGSPATWYCANSGVNSPQCTASRNRKPTVTNGTLAYSVNTSSNVGFTGFSAADADSDTLAYAWACTNGGTFVSNTVANPTYVAPATPRTDTCTLLVSDSYEGTTSSTVTVTVSTLVNGACGTANTHEFYSTADISTGAMKCSAGTFTSFTDNGSNWSWGCTGSGVGHTDASCSAIKSGTSWLSGWAYREPITISNASGGVLTNYQVKEVIAYVAGKMKTDFSDIYFTSYNGNTLIDYWLESKTDSSTATFWVEVPSVPVTGTVIYAYYGKSDAVTASNGGNTFDFFDNFDSPANSLDTDKWSYTGTPSVSGGIVTVTGGSGDLMIYSKTSYGVNYAMRGKIKTAHWESTTHREMGGFTFAQNVISHASLGGKHYISNGTPSTTDILGGVSADTWSTWDIMRNGSTSVIFLIDGGNQAAISTNVPTDNETIRLLAGTTANESKIYADWMLVRKYTSSEPASVLKSEESSPVVNGVCGTSNGQTYASTASIDTDAKKCSAGTYSGAFIDNVGTWTWSCNGTGGGINDSCYANKSTVTKVNGECGPSDDNFFPAAPTTNLCVSGTLPAAPTGVGPWTWTCAGIGTGASSETCNAGVQGTNINAVCGSADGRSSTSIPTTNLCSIAGGGEPTPAGTGPWTWTCAGIGTGSSASCSTLSLPLWHEASPY
ncbi:MAG: DUF2341 domain-containing protein [Candidatus Paceibacterota bacterium]